MTREFRETPNPFKGGRIVGKQVRAADYFKQDVKRGDPAFVMSRGELMAFDNCPTKWMAGVPDDETKATEWGKALDAYLFEVFEVFDDLVAVAPAVYSSGDEFKKWNWNANVCKNWADQQGDKQIISSDMSLELWESVRTLRRDPTICRVIDESDKQVWVSTLYHDRETGIEVLFKVLVDLVPPVDDPDFGKSLIDFKTCRDASPSEWVRAVWQHDYHVQAACYLDAFNSIPGEDRCDFRHILSENVAPWQPGKRVLSQEYIELGREKYVRALERYCQCLATKTWPGYEDPSKINFAGFEIVDPEPYMLTKV